MYQMCLGPLNLTYYLEGQKRASSLLAVLPALMIHWGEMLHAALLLCFVSRPLSWVNMIPSMALIGPDKKPLLVSFAALYYP